MYVCTVCNSLFDEPARVRGGFAHAFGYELEIELQCPYCGADEGEFKSVSEDDFDGELF